MDICIKPKKLKVKCDVCKVYPKLEDLEVMSSTEDQSFKSEEYGYNNVFVKRLPAEIINIEPQKENQKFNGLYKEINVAQVDKNIDKNIDAENIKEGVNILGVDGKVIELKGQTKTIIPSTEVQNITPDAEFNGITSIEVEPVTADIDENIQPENIRANVSVLGKEGTFTKDATATANDIIKNKTAYVNK